MSPFDRAVLAERAMAVERHLRRVAERLPADREGLQPATGASDSVVLHLWQATQIVIDLAMSACLALKLGTPSSYADAFVRLQTAGVVEASPPGWSAPQASATWWPMHHAYESLDLRRVHDAATHGPADLRAFLAVMRDRA